MNSNHRLALAAILLASAAAPAARAQQFIDTNTTITTAVTGDVALGFAGTNPTLTLNNVGGTSGSIDYFLNAYSGRLVMNGGSIFGDVYAFNSSNLTFRGGTVVGNIFAYTNGVLDFDGSLSAAAASSSIAGFRGITITGTLTSGTAINKTIYLHNDSNALVEINGSNTGLGFVPIVSVPEPGSVALLLTLSLTGAGFAAKRRRRV